MPRQPVLVIATLLPPTQGRPPWLPAAEAHALPAALWKASPDVLPSLHLYLRAALPPREPPARSARESLGRLPRRVQAATRCLPALPGLPPT